MNACVIVGLMLYCVVYMDVSVKFDSTILCHVVLNVLLEFDEILS